MKTQTNEQNIKQHYKWFCESCFKRKKEIISYKQFKKEFKEMAKLNNTKEEQERLKNLSIQLNNAIKLLK